MSIPYLYRTVGLYTKFANYQNCRRQLSPAPSRPLAIMDKIYRQFYASPPRFSLITPYFTPFSANMAHRIKESAPAVADNLSDLLYINQNGCSDSRGAPAVRSRRMSDAHVRRLTTPQAINDTRLSPKNHR